MMASRSNWKLSIAWRPMKPPLADRPCAPRMPDRSLTCDSCPSCHTNDAFRDAIPPDPAAAAGPSPIRAAAGAAGAAGMPRARAAGPPAPAAGVPCPNGRPDMAALAATDAEAAATLLEGRGVAAVPASSALRLTPAILAWVLGGSEGLGVAPLLPPLPPLPPCRQGRSKAVHNGDHVHVSSHHSMGMTNFHLSHVLSYP